MTKLINGKKYNKVDYVAYFTDTDDVLGSNNRLPSLKKIVKESGYDENEIYIIKEYYAKNQDYIKWGCAYDEWDYVHSETVWGIEPE